MSGAEEKNTLIFKGRIVNGEMDINTVQMVCIPSKPHYAEVELCLKDGWNHVVADIVGDSLSFEEKKKLGYEIEKRWNAYKKAPQGTIDGVALQPATEQSTPLYKCRKCGKEMNEGEGKTFTVCSECW